MLSGINELYKIYGPLVRRLVKNLEKIQIKLIKFRNQINFLKDCYKFKITPIGFRIANKWEESNKQMDSILKSAERALVKEQINVMYKSIKKIQVTEIGGLIDLYGSLHSSDYRWLLAHLEKKMTASHNKDLNRLDKKLERLMAVGMNSISRDAQVHDSSRGDKVNKFVNLTAKEFSEKEIALLNQGTNYAVKGKVKLLDTIAQLDGLTKDKETVHKLVDALDKRMEETNMTKFQKTHLLENNIIQGLKADKEIKITKADKGGKLVAMNSDEYNAKMKEHVEKKYNKLTMDPTKKLVAQLRLFVSKDLGWSNPLRDDLAPLYPKTPIAYGQPKLHKEGNPLRVIISQKEACYSKIGKFIVKKLNMLLDKPASHIMNGKEFLNKINQRTIPSTTTLISLDVVDMFTSVNINTALSALGNKINGIDDNEFQNALLMSKSQCIKLVSVILNNNYFLYDNEVYIQTVGLAMGSPLSPLLSDLVMENLENEIQRLYNDKIDLWCRFIDDTFIEWIGQKSELEPFLECINTLDASLKFTMEVEKDNALTFLDTKVTKLNGDVITGVYKKPTAGDGIIPFFSCNPLSLKLSVARQKVQRIEDYHNTKNDEFLAKRELKLDLLNNGYPNDVIKKIFHHRNGESSVNANKEEKKFIPLQYDEKLETSFKKIICNDKVGLAWKQKTKILDIYKSSKFPTKNMDIKNAIYVIPCNCGKMYIGETGRPVRVRIKEHMANVRLQRRQSKLYLHLDNTVGHAILWDDTFVLDYEINDKSRKLKEGILIDLNKQFCISDKSVETQKEWEWIIQKFKVKRKYYGLDLFVL